MKYINLIFFQLRKKSNYIIAIIVGLILGIAFLLMTYQNSKNSFIQNDIYESSVFKMIFIDELANEENYLTYSNLPNVTNIIEFVNYSDAVKIKEFDNRNHNLIQIYESSGKSVPTIVKGNNFPDDNENYMICPMNFINNANTDNLVFYNKSKQIDLIPFLNEELTLNYNVVSLYKVESYETKVTLVGLYKNSDYNIDEGICYVNKKTMEEIKLNRYSNDINNYEEQKKLGYVITIDNVENVSKVKNKLDELQLNYQFIGTIDLDVLNNFNSLFNISIKIILVLIFIFIFIVLQKENKSNTEYFKLLKNLGYNKKEMIIIYILLLVVKMIIYIIASLFILLFIILVLKMVLYYYPFLFGKFKIVYGYNVLLTQLFILIICFVFNFILNVIKSYLGGQDEI